ncbi:MAG: LamG domain-containing protein [Candidatus Velthaea sp.]
MLSKRKTFISAAIAFAFGATLLAGCSGNAGSAGSSAVVPAIATSSLRARAALSLDTQTAATATIAYDAAILNDRAVAFYRMNDLTTILHDGAANPTPGSYGAADRLGAAGITSTDYTAVAFPGGNYAPSAVASVLPSAKLQPPIVSVEAWVEPSVPNTSNRSQPIVAYGRFSVGVPYQLTITPINQFLFCVKTATGAHVAIAKTTSWPGRIFHVVGTYDGSSVKLYINGVLEGQSAGSGVLNYGGLYPTTGLAIGSGFDALVSEPIESYAGTIADVSIYNYALTPAQAMSHYLAGVLTPALTERPAAADAFVDSIGVDAPLNYQGTAYDTQYTTVESLLIGSGIRHIRSGLVPGAPQTYYNRLNELGRAGVHSELVTVGTETASQLQAYAALVPQSLEAYEGPNEPDLSTDPNWIADTRNFMLRLHTAIKGNAATAKFPIIGPSIVRPANAAALGDLSADLDYGNIHPYYGPYNPGNVGTGSISALGRVGSTQYYMNAGAQVSGPKPIFATETGFGTNLSIAGNVSELCDGKETPRTYFMHFKSGIARTLTFQLIEQATAYGALGPFSYMGLLRQDLSPKPSYTALKSLIGLLSDKGSAFSTTPITYTIRGDVNNLQHLLMQKRNGLYYLALWLETPSWNAATNQDLAVPAQAITVTLPSTMRNGYLYQLNDLGQMSQSIAVLNHGTASVQVSDRVMVLAFQPY